MTPLHAGPLSLLLDGPDLRSIRFGEREVLRRIYAAVRDRDWGTVPGSVHNLDVRRDEKGFRVSFECRHQRDEIDFRWRAHLTGTPAGEIDCLLDGEAHSTFWRNRIGWCVHHPLRGVAGQPCWVETATGRRQASFPALVEPHQPFLDLRAITHQIRPGLPFEIRFEGDTFEMEDHRNWTDGGFKIYSTPLTLPYPVRIEAGTRIRQRVRCQLGALAAPEPAPAGPVRLEATRTSVALPRWGFAVNHPVSDLARLRRLHPDHVRWDLHPDQDPQPPQLGLPLELALYVHDDPAAEAKRAAAAIPAAIPAARIARVLVFHPSEKATRSSTVQTVRQHFPNLPVFGGSDAYFAELNRNRPQDPALGASFPINPQVHATDDLSLIENLEAQRDAVLTAKSFVTGPIAVSPVTLRIRVNPDATSGARGEAPPDPRQRTAFTAAWTLGSFAYLTEAGTSIVTYFEAEGPRGLAEGSETFPVFSVFALLDGFQGGRAVPVTSSDPLRVLALLIKKDNRQRLLIANLTPVPQSVSGLWTGPLQPWQVESIEP